MPIPTGVMMSERKRVFSGLQVLQLCVLGQLVANRTDVGTAAIIAESATNRFAHDDKVGSQLDDQGLAGLVDIGLFVEPANGREVHPSTLRETNLLPEIDSIQTRYAEAIQLVAAGDAPKPHTFIPIGQLAQLLIRMIADHAKSPFNDRSQPCGPK